MRSTFPNKGTLSLYRSTRGIFHPFLYPSTEARRIDGSLFVKMNLLNFEKSADTTRRYLTRPRRLLPAISNSQKHHDTRRMCASAEACLLGIFSFFVEMVS